MMKVLSPGRRIQIQVMKTSLRAVRGLRKLTKTTRAKVGEKINSVRKSTRESALEPSRFSRSVHVSKVLSLIRVAAESLLND